ncbi:flavin reductase family protein [Aquibium carbonis]|uniref:Flavin reductase family protein n=1 Tax=Aquibium carbonis TaxID=2495581 RepID=A0A3R9ZS62_9HYPH|nr:flavin reductase family protein [Aquibium carbonis]RST86430.1 flavin reductase family protein [Aquibium carbonis]
MFYEAAKGHGLPHDPLKAIVAPRPIGWISSRNAVGELNLAPYSFFNALSSRPMLVWFSSEGEKDSVTFIRETGEFVANLVTRDLADAMNATSVDAPRGVSEFGYAGLTPAPSRLVAAPRVAEAHAALECRVTEIFQPKLLDGSKAGVTVVTGQVVGVHIDDDYLTDGMFDTARAQNLARLGYHDYAAVQEVFQMRRPRWERG